MSRASTISAWASKLNRRKSSWVVDEGLLRSLVPLNLLGADELKQLAGHARVTKLAGGKALERDPAAAASTGYLLSGIVELLADGEPAGAVAAGTDAARQPLWGSRTGRVTLRAKTEVTILELDVAADQLALSSGSTAADYEVSDIRSATATDWLTRFLQAKVFTRLPLNNIRELLARMEEIDVTAGQAIMRQGESDEFYYIVKRGSCRVTTRPANSREDIELARLSEGDGFGEDALITDGRRSATVTMLADGSLMRLNKKDFTSLLVEPVLQYVDGERARVLLGQGAVLLDVRKPEEYTRDGLPGALNVPLGLLRSRCLELQVDATYITVSNVLNRSTAAAFLLCQRGIDAHILKDGVKALAAMMPAADAAGRNRAVPAKERRTAPALVLVSDAATTARAQPEAAPPAAPPPAAPQATARAVAPAGAAERAPMEAPPSGQAHAAAEVQLAAVRAELAREAERRRELEAAAADYDAVSRRAGRLEEEAAAREAEMAVLSARMTDAEARRTDLEAQLAALQEELGGMQRSRAQNLSLEAELEALRDAQTAAECLRGDLERQLDEQRREVRRLQQALDGGESIKAELAALQHQLQEQRDLADAAAEQGREAADELHRLRPLERQCAALQADLDAAARDLEEKAHVAAQAQRDLSARDEQLQELQRSRADGAALQDENASLARRLQHEAGRREAVEAQLADAQSELERRAADQASLADLEADLARLNESLQRERGDRRAFERELALQTVELQRLRRDRDEEAGQGEERFVELQREAATEREQRAAMEADAAAQAQKLQQMAQQADRLRRRLKKVCALARNMDRGRRTSEQDAGRTALEIKDLKDQVYERSLRLAEAELSRRKLEQEIAALRKQGERPAVGAPPRRGDAAAPLPPPADDARDDRLARLAVWGRRTVQAAILIVITLLCVYGLLAAGILKAHAGDWQDQIMQLAGLLHAR